MIPIVTNVFDLTRAHLGDTQVTGGSLFTDSFLLKYWPGSYSPLFRYLDKKFNKKVLKDTYFNLPAFTGYLTPAGMGIQNMGTPLEIRDRAIAFSGSGTVAAFNVGTSGTPPSVDIAISTTPFLSGQEVATIGFSGSSLTDDINDVWYIQVVNSNTLRLLGCAATSAGSAVGQTGIVSKGSTQFSDCALPQLFDYSNAPLSATGSQLTQWKWENGAFRFVPSTTDRQIKVTYKLSGNAPTSVSASVGIDDSADALSLYLGGLASAAKGRQAMSQSLFMRAVGNPSGDEDMVRGGAFMSLAKIGMQALSETQVVMPRYRRKRNTGNSIAGW